MVFQAKKGTLDTIEGNKVEDYGLPKTQFRRSSPELINFLLVAGFDQGIVHNGQRMGRNIFWERREYACFDDHGWEGSVQLGSYRQLFYWMGLAVQIAPS